MSTTNLTASATTPDELRDALRQTFGFEDFRPGQEEIVRAVLAGEDLLAILPTGRGKSLTYQLPAALLDGVTVVISPLIALMKDQLDSLPPALRARAAVFSGAVDRDERDANLAALAAGDLSLVYAAPERLRQRAFVHALARAGVARIVIDEAHCISLWGNDFRPDYLFIPAVLGDLGAPPVLALTATATPAVQEDICARLGRSPRVLDGGVLRPNLYLQVEQVSNKDEKHRRLVEICTALEGSGIVYVSSRENAETVARILRDHRVNARHYHAGLSQPERAATQDAFMSGQTRVIVATVAFGMGVDKADVRFIVHFNPSRSLEAYTQEAGRAGRDGLPARCILFWAASDKSSLNRWAREDALSRDLLNAVWRGLRALRQENWTLANPDQVAAAAGDALAAAGRDAADRNTDTLVRVVTGTLESAGALRRHYDVPERIQVRLTAGVKDTPLAAQFDIPPGPTATLDTLTLAERLELSPATLEAALLDWQDAGLLMYQPLNRTMLVEFLPPPPDLPERLRATVDGALEADERRVQTIGAYAISTRCRTATIARHFGVAAAGCCATCDVCHPEGRLDSVPATAAEPAAPPPDRSPRDIVLAALQELRFSLGKSGIVRLLKGTMDSRVKADRSSWFGALAAASARDIERAVESLVDEGYLEVRMEWAAGLNRDVPMHYVTPAGRSKSPDPWPPVRKGGGGATRSGRSRTSTTAAPDDTGPDEFDADEEARFEQLRAWRSEQAAAQAVPPYVIFPDTTLRLLAAADIQTVADLTGIKGIGPAKLERYGAALVELLAGD